MPHAGCRARNCIPVKTRFFVEILIVVQMLLLIILGHLCYNPYNVKHLDPGRVICRVLDSYLSMYVEAKVPFLLTGFCLVLSVSSGFNAIPAASCSISFY